MPGVVSEDKDSRRLVSEELEKTQQPASGGYTNNSRSHSTLQIRIFRRLIVMVVLGIRATNESETTKPQNQHAET